MKNLMINIIAIILLALLRTADGAEGSTLTSEESFGIIRRMMDSLPPGRWMVRGVLKTDRTKSQNDGTGVLVERITSYVEPDRVLQEFEVLRQAGKFETPDSRISAEAKKRIDSAKQLLTTSAPATKRTVLTEQGRFLTYASAPFHSAMIDESGRLPYQQGNFVLSAGLFQKQGFLSKENLRLATLSGKRGTAGHFLEITVTRPDFTAVIAIDPKTVRPLSCKISEKNDRSQLWEYEWGSEERVIPLQVTITTKSKDLSETDNFRYQWVSEATKPDDFHVEFPYGTSVEYFPPPNGSARRSIIYIHNPAIDVQNLIARRLQFVLSQQERKNCATAVLNAVEEKFGVSFGDTSSIVHFPDANQTPGKNPVGVTSAIEIREMIRSKGLYSEIVRTDIEHLAALGDGTMAILHLPNRRHFTIFVGVYGGKDVWVSQADTAKCLYILNRTDLDAWNGTAILISSKPIATADQSTPKGEPVRSLKDIVPQNRSAEP